MIFIAACNNEESTVSSIPAATEINVKATPYDHELYAYTEVTSLPGGWWEIVVHVELTSPVNLPPLYATPQLVRAMAAIKFSTSALDYRYTTSTGSGFWYDTLDGDSFSPIFTVNGNPNAAGYVEVELNNSSAYWPITECGLGFEGLQCDYFAENEDGWPFDFTTRKIAEIHLRNKIQYVLPSKMGLGWRATNASLLENYDCYEVGADTCPIWATVSNSQVHTYGVTP